MTYKTIVPTLVALTLALSGCDQVMALINPAKDPAAIVEDAQGKLKSGELPDAASAYDKLAGENKDVTEVLIGQAYTQFLAGKYDKADSTLEAALSKEDLSDEVKGEIMLRRALIALKNNNLENVKNFGEQSEMAAGQVLAAEVYLADAEADAAIPLLTKAKSGGSGAVKRAASEYLEYIEDEDTGRAQLAEATALWALGQRAEACETAADLLSYMPADFEGRDALLLMWAGRAVTSERPDEAESLLDQMGAPPEGQAWRVQATRGLVHVARGETEEGKAIFMALGQGGAPQDGLADALATAAAVSGDGDFAKEMTAGLGTAAAARGLMEAGAMGAAKEEAPSGPLKDYLENK